MKEPQTPKLNSDFLRRSRAASAAPTETETTPVRPRASVEEVFRVWGLIVLWVLGSRVKVWGFRIWGVGFRVCLNPTSTRDGIFGGIVTVLGPLSCVSCRV